MSFEYPTDTQKTQRRHTVVSYNPIKDKILSVNSHDLIYVLSTANQIRNNRYMRLYSSQMARRHAHFLPYASTITGMNIRVTRLAGGIGRLQFVLYINDTSQGIIYEIDGNTLPNGTHFYDYIDLNIDVPERVPVEVRILRPDSDATQNRWDDLQVILETREHLTW